MNDLDTDNPFATTPPTTCGDVILDPLDAAIARGRQEQASWSVEALSQAREEIGRLRAIIRVNALRWNPALSHAEIDAVIHGKPNDLPWMSMSSARRDETRLLLDGNGWNREVGYWSAWASGWTTGETDRMHEPVIRPAPARWCHLPESPHGR